MIPRQPPRKAELPPQGRDPPTPAIGDRVQVISTQGKDLGAGTVRWTGQLASVASETPFVGVEMDRGSYGQGSHHGHRYFHPQRPNSAVLTPVHTVYPVDEPPICPPTGSGSSASGVQDRRQRAQTLEERRLMKITEGGGLTPLQSAVDRISWLERLQGDWERHDMEHAARKRMVREHRQRLEQRVGSWGFCINPETDASGNCQFDAIADQLRVRSGLKVTKEEVRQTVVEWLRNNPTFELCPDLPLYSVFGVYETSFSSLEEYCDYMAQEYRWGDIWTLIAACQAYDVAICIFSSTEDTSESSQRLHFGSVESLVTLYLGHIIELHYVSLLDDTAADSSTMY